MIKNLEKQIKKILKKESPHYMDRFGVCHPYDYTIEIYDDIFYIKFKYDYDIEYFNIENLYISAIRWFNKLGYNFHGLTEYRDNHEICLDFIKEYR